MRDAVRQDGDHRDRLFGRHGADDLQNLGARQAEAAHAGDFDFDQIAVLGLFGEIGIDDLISSPRFSIGMIRPPPPGVSRNTPMEALAAFVDDLDDAGGIGRAAAIGGRKDLCQNTVAETGDRRLALVARRATIDG